MEIPMGKHKIEFIFEPETYKLSSKIANFSGWSFYVILALTVLVGYMNYKKKMVI
jgi:hypothetical protein